MNISSRFLKLNGSFEIPNDLEIGKDYEISLVGSLIGCNEIDEHDGTHSYEYRYKPLLGQIIAQKGASVALKDKKGQSFRLRYHHH